MVAMGGHKTFGFALGGHKTLGERAGKVSRATTRVTQCRRQRQGTWDGSQRPAFAGVCGQFPCISAWFRNRSDQFSALRRVLAWVCSENLRVGERHPERTTGCMNASLIRNCGPGTPDFSTIQGATGGTAVGMTSSGGTKSLKCCAESGQAKMAGHSNVRADVMTQAGTSILLKLPKCIIVRCTRVPVRIGQNWADCNTLYSFATMCPLFFDGAWGLARGQLLARDLSVPVSL